MSEVIVLDKRIRDFPILEEAQDDDVLLASTDTDTYALRVKAFNERYAAGEQARMDAEVKRATAEQNRETSENSRVETEGKRDDAELQRQENEKARQSAETAREEAETDREQKHTAAMGEAAEATQQATDAAAMAKELAEHPDDPRNGTWWRWDLEQHAYVDTGQRAVLNYDKVYPSVEAMEGDADNQPPSTTAIISTDVNIEDNAKLYVKRTDGTWGFIADLSGFPGVGIESVKQTAGDHTPGTTDTYTIKLTDERQIEVPVYNGSNGQDGEVSIDQLTAAVETARSRSWEVVVPAEGWIESAATWGDLEAKWETTIEVPDMTDIPDIIKIDFVDGSRQANGRWTWVACDVGSVTLYSTHNTPPESEFTTRITEVR